MKCLVTGASGFIGTNLVKRLKERGDEVYAHFFKGNNVENMKVLESYADKLIDCDIRDMGYASRLVEITSPDVIFHLAAKSGIPYSVENTIDSYKVNVDGTFHLLDAARSYKVDQFIFASSCGSVLGNKGKKLEPNMKPSPRSPYGAFKNASESICISYGRTFGMKTKIVRFSNVFGEFSAHKKSLISEYIKCALGQKEFNIYGNGMQVRDFIHVDEVIDNLFRIADYDFFITDADIFHVSSGIGKEVVAVISIINKYLKKLGIEPPYVRFNDEKEYDVQKSTAAPTLTCFNSVEYQSYLEEKIEQTVNWFYRRK